MFKAAILIFSGIVTAMATLPVAQVQFWGCPGSWWCPRPPVVANATFSIHPPVYSGEYIGHVWASRWPYRWRIISAKGT